MEKQKAVAVLEIGESKKSEYLNGYESGFYQASVTAFEPDTGYVETLLGKDGNIRIYPKKKKGSSQRGSGNRAPSHLNESPFANSLAENEPKVKSYDETSSAGKLLALKASDIDNAFETLYNEVTLPWAERRRLESEVLTWDSGRRNQLRVRTLTNGIICKYVIDDESNVHVYDRAIAKNIHERGMVYDNTDRKEPDRLAEELGVGQRNDNSDLDTFENRRKQAKDDRRALLDDIPQEKNAKRTGSTHDRSGSYGRKEVVSAKKVNRNSEISSDDFSYSDAERKNALDVDYNKKNRVIVAQFALDKAIASTPHSPRFTDSISHSEQKNNPSAKKSLKGEQLLRIDGEDQNKNSRMALPNEQKITIESDDELTRRIRDVYETYQKLEKV